jgi:hypothetical protein
VTVLVMRPEKQAPTTSAAATPAPIRIFGTLTVDADVTTSEDAVGGSCFPSDGYSDIRLGAQVTVTDDSGKVVALGSLQAGKVSELWGEDTPSLFGFASKCEFDFTVDQVPAGHPFYSIEVAHRGQVRFTPAQLDSNVALTLA